MIDYDFSTGANGWTCGVCGIYVWGNNIHQCGGACLGTYPLDGISSFPAMFEIDPNKEINDKLDEILKLLKRLT